MRRYTLESYDFEFENGWDFESLELSSVLSVQSLSEVLTATQPGPLFADIDGTSGDDTLNGTAGDDVINGLAGNDTISGLAGNDTLNGGDSNDNLSGGDGNDILNGGNGIDTLIGGAGSDQIDGGLGNDNVNYQSSNSGVTVNFMTGVNSGGDAEGDLITNVTGVLGSNFDDVITGHDGYFFAYGYGGDDVITGGNGNDYYYPGWGSDTINGGDGIDTVSYAFGGTGGGVTVSLLTPTGSAGDAQGDVFINIENLTGTFSDDHLTGDNNANYISATSGNDYLSGLGGDDRLVGSLGDDILRGGEGADILEGNSGIDTVEYFDSNAAVTINLSTGMASGGHANGDTFVEVENILGSDSFGDDLTGDVNDNVLQGFGGNDNLDGGAGVDTAIFSGLLADYTVVDNMDSTYSITDNVGTDGSDTLTSIEFLTFADGTVDIATAASGNNIINGTSNDDNLLGTAGNDTINGLAGNDVIRGRAGDDELYGGDGDDFIKGEAGTDFIDGGAGFDRISFFDLNATQGVEADLRTGITTNDGYGNEETFVNIEGLGGGTIYVDTFHGDDNDNLIIPSGLGDLAYGYGGDDSFQVDAAGTFDGGDGVDTILITSGYWIADITGDNFPDFQEQSVGVNINLETGLIANDGHGNTGSILNFENLTVFSAFNDAITGNDLNNELSSGDGNDILNGLGGDDTIIGGAGADTLIGGAGADVLDGGDGFDSVDYRAATSRIVLDMTSGGTLGDAAGDSFVSIERLYATNFNDTITGTGANEFFFGEDGNDTINAGGGIDRVYGGDGDDIQRGQEGNDTLYGSAGADQLNGGTGFDIANYQGASSAITVNLATSGTGGDAAGDTYFGIEAVYGSDFNDSMVGSSGTNELRGFAGDDILDGAGGNDRLFGGEGADMLIGGIGVDIAMYTVATSGVTLDLTTTGLAGEATGDTFDSIEWVFGSNFDDDISGDEFNNRLEGRDGDDTLNGGDGNDRLLGGDGNDIINGGDGVDTIFGQDGDDVMTGGAGNDFFFGGAGADSHDGGDDIDTVSYLASTSGVTVNMQTGGTGGDAAGDTYTNIERIFGTSFDDSIRGSDSDDVLLGNGGADFLDGGLGDDTLIGGAGIDSFGYNMGEGGADVITGFFSSNEVIYLLGVVEDGEFGPFDFEDLIDNFATDVGANTVFDFFNGNTLTLVGLNIEDLSASNFDFSGIPPAQEMLDDLAFAGVPYEPFDADGLGQYEGIWDLA